MNKIYKTIISHIRESIRDDEEFVAFMALTDEQIIRRMFSNYRGERGLRLTQFGVQIMRQFFKGYEIKVPEDEKMQPLHLIFLDRRAKMPYYCGDKEIVIYDPVLAVKLRLLDGRISLLLEIETLDEKIY